MYVGDVVCTRNTIVDCLYLGYVDSMSYKYKLLASVHVGDVATPKRMIILLTVGVWDIVVGHLKM